MNFDLTEEQQMIMDQAAKFVANESPVSRFRQLRETERGWEPEMWAKMAEQGWLAIAIPEEQGGFGGSFVDLAIILEQLGRGLVPEPFIASAVLAGGILSDLGDDAQREAWLNPMIEGRTSLAFAYAETQSRYNPSDCLTRAEKSGGGWTLSGEKVWVLNGHAADQIIVVARTGGSQLDEAGLSLFVIDGEAKGLTRIRVPGMDGQRTAVLRLDGVEVGADRLLGREGEAFPSIEKAIDRGAAAACAEGLGQVRELFERTVAYLKEREQFGVPIGSFQALQHVASDMYSEVELCSSASILASIQADNPDEDTRKADISAAKLQLADGGWFVQENAIQLFGGIGITDEQDEGLFFKRLRVLNGLFGDADWHVARFQSLKGFEAID
ncbi:MAG TPA: pimeloyl-CoA dehydrogenase small subunit [Deltaproteobacteria bacterium]|nr:pimeloyl-CoA dehydrogenase small subunit [Deltaproteobacteria bacterium]